jgi:hypothetical protein
MTATRPKGKHVLAAVAYLRSRGASNVRLETNKHMKVWFSHPKGDFIVTMASTPENEDVAAERTRRIIRRLLRTDRRGLAPAGWGRRRRERKTAMGHDRTNSQSADRIHPQILPTRSAALSLLIHAGVTLPEIQYLADEIDQLEAGSQRGLHPETGEFIYIVPDQLMAAIQTSVAHKLGRPVRLEPEYD